VPQGHLSYLTDPLIDSYRHGGDYKALFLSPTLPTVTALVIGSLALAVFRRATARGRTSQEDVKHLLFIFIPALLILNLLMFQKWNKGLGSWYLVLPTVGTVFSVFVSLQSIERNRVKYAVNAGIVLLLVFSASQYLRLLPETLKQRNIAVGTLLAVRQSPQGSILAGTDVGYLAFWSGRKVVNLDGLINNYDYQKILRNGQLRKYLQDIGVDYLVVTAWADKPRFQLRDNEYMYNHRINSKAVYGKDYVYDFYVYSYMYNTYSDHIWFTSEQEVYRSDIYIDGGNDARTLIFDLTRREKSRAN
jgi:hypothetical protein